MTGWVCKGKLSQEWILLCTMTDTAVSPNALAITESVSAYMTSYFQNMIHSSTQYVEIPSEWDCMLLHECHQALAILKRAYDNQSMYLNWTLHNDTDKHFQRTQPGLQSIMILLCPKIRLAETSELRPKLPNDFLPSIIRRNMLRNHARYLTAKEIFYYGICPEPLCLKELWVHMPNTIFTPFVKVHCKDHIFSSISIIEKSFAMKTKSSSWRDGPTMYQSHSGWYKAGTLSLSPAWFRQAHSVRTFMSGI